jgi:hypothetical protein
MPKMMLSTLTQTPIEKISGRLDHKKIAKEMHQLRKVVGHKKPFDLVHKKPVYNLTSRKALTACMSKSGSVFYNPLNSARIKSSKVPRPLQADAIPF